MENGAEEAESRGGAMPAKEDRGKTACGASVNARRVMERNNLWVTYYHSHLPTPSKPYN